MGIRALDNNRTADHKEFLAIAKHLIQEVSAIKAELQSTIADQAVQLKKLVEETHNAYESTVAVLQSTLNNLRLSLFASSHGQEILKLTKEIHQLLFNTKIPDNQQLNDILKSQFNNVFSKIDALLRWFEEKHIVTSSKRGNEHSYPQRHQSTAAVPIPNFSPSHFGSSQPWIETQLSPTHSSANSNCNYECTQASLTSAN